MSLKEQAYSAVRWTSVAMIGRSVLSFIQMAILARLLAPSDFGLMALISAVVAFAEIFSDMGVSNAIIHHQKISHEELSSLYWLNVVAGIGMMVILAISGSLIASFYDTPSLQPVLMLVSMYFVISALGLQLRVVARKEMRFAALARIELLAAACGFTATVTWAFLWPDVYALVVGMLVSGIVSTTLSWKSLAAGWRPMWRMRIQEIRHFLSFGSYTMANSLVNTINGQADIFIGGRFLTTSALGMYSLPRDLSLRLAVIINSIVTRVGLPMMANAQHDKHYLRNIYIKTLRMTVSVNFPIYTAMVVFAPEVVTILFGKQWMNAAPLLRILALWGMFRSTGNLVGSLCYAVGRADLEFKWNLILLFIVPPLLWVGVQQGSMGLAITFFVLTLTLSVPAWYFLVRPLCGAGFVEYYGQMLKTLLASGISAFIAYLVVWQLEGAFTRLVVGVPVGGLIYVSLSRYMNPLWFDAARELLSGGRFTKRS